jgi:transcription initiation factor IIE alpha subunit
MRKYVIESWSRDIKPVDVTRETAKLVFTEARHGICGTRRERRYEKSAVYDTWALANAEVISMTMASIAILRGRLREAEQRLEEVTNMKDPTCQSK